MNRTLTLAAIAVAALMPAASSAGSTDPATAGRGGNDLKIRFDLVKRGNKPVRIEDFVFKNFTVTCAIGGPKDADGSISRMGINDAGKFDGNAKRNNAKVHVEGQVKQNGKKVVGTLKATGDFGGGAQNCNRTVGWEAT